MNWIDREEAKRELRELNELVEMSPEHAEVVYHRINVLLDWLGGDNEVPLGELLDGED